jgi:hypothetical protein
MRKYAGATCIVLGIVLSGLETGESIDSGWSRLFAGWTVDRPMLIGGVLTLIVGLSLWLLNERIGPKEEQSR